VPNAKTAAAIRAARKGGLGAHATVAELMADLHADDLVLIYSLPDASTLRLVRLGSHAESFG
jgi:mRNA-degrading endonuclease YafQ of YafQ-DinJ toxin-antitoxin module